MTDQDSTEGAAEGQQGRTILIVPNEHAEKVWEYAAQLQADEQPDVEGYAARTSMSLGSPPAMRPDVLQVGVGTNCTWWDSGKGQDFVCTDP